MKHFDTLIQPILTYANEIWISDYKLDLLDDKYPFELVHLKSCKFSLGVHNKVKRQATIRNRHNQFPHPALKTKREITKYINWRQFTKGTRGKLNEQLFP